jgi:hypothetical protein
MDSCRPIKEDVWAVLKEIQAKQEKYLLEVEICDE